VAQQCRRRALKEEKVKAVPIAPKEPEVGDVIGNDKVVAEAVTQFQTKFAKEMRNILLYKLSPNT
jgi:hypothetical protein